MTINRESVSTHLDESDDQADDAHYVQPVEEPHLHLLRAALGVPHVRGAAVTAV